MRATQPMYLKGDLKTFDLSSLGSKFDVMLIEPPLEEYQRRASGINFTWMPWEWEEVSDIYKSQKRKNNIIMQCGSTPYVGMARGKNGQKYAIHVVINVYELYLSFSSVFITQKRAQNWQVAKSLFVLLVLSRFFFLSLASTIMTVMIQMRRSGTFNRALLWCHSYLNFWLLF